jgi:hypothetical protein
MSRDVLGAAMVIGEFLADLWPAESGTEAGRSMGDDETYPLRPEWHSQPLFLGIGADAGGSLRDPMQEAMSIGDGIFFTFRLFVDAAWEGGAIGKSNGENPITTSNSSGEVGLFRV